MTPGSCPPACIGACRASRLACLPVCTVCHGCRHAEVSHACCKSPAPPSAQLCNKPGIPAPDARFLLAVALLPGWAVLTSYDKQDQDVQEDYKVVKSRMDVCAQLQKDNPMVYKMRADFCMVGATACRMGAGNGVLS